MTQGQALAHHNRGPGQYNWACYHRKTVRKGGEDPSHNVTGFLAKIWLPEQQDDQKSSTLRGLVNTSY